MGQKVNPIGLRLGINRTWDSRWYADRHEYSQLLHEDLKIRDYLLEKLKQAGVARIIIERPHKKCRVTIHSARPGVVIGKKGADIEKLKTDLGKYTKSEVHLNIVEIRKPEVDAHLIAESIAQQLERLGVPCGVVTLGARGCCARQGGQWWLQPGFAVDAIDSTAAGDTFCGALAAALSRRQTLAEALRQASAAGALACTRLGAQSSIPLRSAVNAFLQTQPAPNSQQLEALLQYCGLPRPTA